MMAQPSCKKARWMSGAGSTTESLCHPGLFGKGRKDSRGAGPEYLEKCQVGRQGQNSVIFPPATGAKRLQPGYPDRFRSSLRSPDETRSPLPQGFHTLK